MVVRLLGREATDEGPLPDYSTSGGRAVSAEDLPRLSDEEQRDVMATWFRERYEDPAEGTPYESAEGGYIWIWGGPYDAAEVLGDEFSDKVNQETIDSLAEDLASKCLDWAPIPRPDDYDVLVEDIATISEYYAIFSGALEDIRHLAKTEVDEEVAPCLYRLLYVNVITALETYLSEAFRNTVLNDSILLRRFVETTPDFKKEKVNFSEIYSAVADARKKAGEYLDKVTWHDLARVKRMYGDVLNVDVDAGGPVFRAVLTRHHLVHRNGKTREGEVIPIDKGQVLALADEVEGLVGQIDEGVQAAPSAQADRAASED